MRSIKKLLLIYTVLGVLFIQQPSYAAFNFKFPKFFKFKKEKKVEENQQQQSDNSENFEEEIMPDDGEYLQQATDTTSADDSAQTNAVYISQVEIFGNNIIETSFIKDQLSAKEGYLYDRKTISADLNKIYLANNQLSVITLGRGYAWLDTGTVNSLSEAAEFVKAVEIRTGIPIAVLEEIAFRNGWIDIAQLKESIKAYGKAPYGMFLKKILENKLISEDIYSSTSKRSIDLSV